MSRKGVVIERSGMVGGRCPPLPLAASYTLDDHCPLGVQLVGIPGVGFLLAVLQAAAGVCFQHTVLRAEVAVAKAAVADDPLGGLLALLEVASGLAGRSHGGWRCRCGGEGG